METDGIRRRDARLPEVEAEGVLPAASPDQGGSMTEYTLPELDYDYAALEPHISARIMELHHSKHHACLLYTSPSPRDVEESRMPSSA